MLYKTHPYINNKMFVDDPSDLVYKDDDGIWYVCRYDTDENMEKDIEAFLNGKSPSNFIEKFKDEKVNEILQSLY